MHLETLIWKRGGTQSGGIYPAVEVRRLSICDPGALRLRTEVLRSVCLGFPEQVFRLHQPVEYTAEASIAGVASLLLEGCLRIRDSQSLSGGH